jgi:hypothetical protein
MTKRPTVLEAALASRDLVETLSIIMAALGLEQTTCAGAEFSKPDVATYARLDDAYARATFIRSWLMSELDTAAVYVEVASPDELKLSANAAERAEQIDRLARIGLPRHS